ncbi:Brix domain-containing protein [Geopyxis carbonaria]|nr:Brix domain-containing protein [Geopyxis carbonaria]
MARRRTKKRTHLAHPNTSKLPTKTSATGVAQPLNASASPIPKTMVIRIGASDVGPSVSSLVHDVRTMMEPHTASRLRERKSNKLKDYTTMAGPLGVTQMLLFSRSETGHTNLRIARCPRGPTIHFRVAEYSLCKDLRKALRNPKSPGKEFATPPLLVMNNLKTTMAPNADGTPARTPPQDELLMSTFRSLFPELTVNTPVSAYRRVLVLNRRPVAVGNDTEYVIDVRHYAISTKAVGLSKPIRRLNAAERRGGRDTPQGRRGGLPNLGKLEDIADYMLDPAAAAGGYTSESEVDDDATVEVLNPAVRRVGGARKRRAPAGPEKKSIHLVELGPRMTLEMTKIEEGLADGRVLWHAYEKKTKAQQAELEARHAKSAAQREKRRKEQLENVRRKKELKEQMKTSKRGARKDGEGGEDADAEKSEGEDEDEDEEMWDDDELAEYAAEHEDDEDEADEA